MEEVKKKRLLKDVTVTHVSYVKRGANKKQFFLAKSDCDRADIQFDIKFFSKNDNDEKRLLYGIVYEPNVEDAHGDFMTEDEIEKTAHEFLEHYRNIDTEHNLLAGAGIVVESYVSPISMNIGGNAIKAGSWVLVTKANEEIWESWKNGDITGYSMFGISRETQMSKGETKVKKWLAKLLEAIGVSKDFETTMSDTFEKMSKNPFFILDIMQEDFFKSISWDSMPDEQLVALSSAMKSATTYIDSKVSASVLKSEESSEDTNVEQTKPDESENEVVSTADNETKTEVENETKTEDESDLAEKLSEPDDSEDNSESDRDILLKNLIENQQKMASVLDELSKEITESNNNIKSEMDNLKKSIDDTNSKLNETRTDSAIVMPGDNVIAKRVSRGNGLL